jgi:hypothetical protein
MNMARLVGDPFEQSTFIRQGDYWMIRYQGQTTILKATRGLDYLCYLLQHPAVDVHVSELLAIRRDLSISASPRSWLDGDGYSVTAGLPDAGPILDSQAKAEYRRRIDELRKDLQEAKRLNDSYRASSITSELDTITEELKAAVGLGGRDRRASSAAERARSAITKRIKDVIKKIKNVAPVLGCHLAARIKTGYFCSYNPHPNRPVSWRF